MIDRSKLKQLDKNSPYYPVEWKALPFAPDTIEYFGNPELLTKRKLTAVGSRKTPANALKAGTKAVQTLSKRFVIVTGVADGGDSAVIEGALENGNVICVLAGGFSALPQSNLPLLRKVARVGLLLSPYGFETGVRGFSYAHRNKLLAMLGEGTFVIGAGLKSGALNTAEYALREKKKVFAFPYAPATADGEGCNALIKKGAYLVENAEDILQHFGINVTAKEETTLTEEERNMLGVLQELGEGHISALAQQSGLPVFKASAVLSALILKGRAVSMGGNRYMPV